MATLNPLKEIDPRIIKLFKKKALRKTLPMVITFAVIMLIIHDVYVTLFCGFFFSIFWYIVYLHVLYFLFHKKFPEKFPILQATSNNEYWDFNKSWNSDTINNPAYRSLSCNIYHDR
jgi:fatty acid desaturase